MKNPFKIGSYLTLLLLFAVLYPLSVPAQRVGGKLLCRIPKNGERFTVEAVSVAEPSDSAIWDFSDIKPLLCADDAADALVYDGAMDFHDGANEEEEYDYDANGNLTKDLNKGISRITYDWNNLPREVIFASDATTRYTYDASGRKLQAEYTKINSATEMEISIIPSVPLVETDIIDYQGDNIYRNGALERTLTPNGYIVNDTVYYYVKDYQGNVRNVVREDGAVVESNEYYPYGGLFSATPSAQPYKYGAKELDRTHGLDWYDSKSRFYDSILLRTNSMDKKAGDYTWLSPYLWCAANPIRFTDPTGEEIRIYYSEEEYVIFKHGNLYNNDNSEYTGANQFVWSVFGDLLSYSQEKVLSERLSDLEQSEQIQEIRQTDNSNIFIVNDLNKEEQHQPVGGTIFFNPAQYYLKTLGDVIPSEGLSHELLGHAWDSAYGKTDFRRTLKDDIPMYEIKAIYIENIVRKLNKRPRRTTYKGNKIDNRLLINPFKF